MMNSSAAVVYHRKAEKLVSISSTAMVPTEARSRNSATLHDAKWPTHVSLNSWWERLATGGVFRYH